LIEKGGVLLPRMNFWLSAVCVIGAAIEVAAQEQPRPVAAKPQAAHSAAAAPVDYGSMLFVLTLATFVGIGVIARVSRLLHTPLMSLTNAISAIAVVGAIIVTGGDYPAHIRVLGFIALVASTTNIVSGFLITDRMLKMFKQPGEGGKR
jgi:NAD(P) transhydrogenase subunit alpha